ncbi:hypothetical protein CYG49_04375 [Candidatus Saccharibacteria bacterium]|nr:MAG: hypothetical protein CYG49_04375 [Candidatus Saccharibacteria bacterium]
MEEEKRNDTGTTTPLSERRLPIQEKRSRLGLLGAIFLCFVASFLGSWLFLATGLVRPNASQAITENRQQLVSQESEIITDVANKVQPSTVSILTQSQGRDMFGTLRQRQGAGTGIIVSKDGYVLTNKHVIPEGATDVTVVASDGTTYDNVRVIGSDPLNDIAFLKIPNVSNLAAAKIGDSNKVVTGQKVIAIGNALGEYQNTVTSGIISGIGRPVSASDGEEVEQLNDLFQTDAAINPGNSGGPLLNLNGEVIGVNTAVAEGAEGIGFAIPINSTKGLLKTVLEDGEVARAYLGVRYVSINNAIAKEFNLSVKNGAYVNGAEGQGAVASGSPADRAGIRNGDIITKVNGTEVNQRTSFGTLLAQFTPGETVTLTILRDGKTQEIKVELTELES